MEAPTIIVYKGVKFRRYPNSNQFSHRMYYRPHIGAAMRGVKSLHQEIWMDANGPIPDGHEIHHKDENPLNNSLSNLECIDRVIHNKEHGKRRRGILTDRHKKQLDSIRPLAAKWHSTLDGIAWHKMHGAESWKGREKTKTTCIECKEVFETWLAAKPAKFCSSRCLQRSQKKRGMLHVKSTCPVCKKEKMFPKYRKGAVTCSRKCNAVLKHGSKLVRAR